nr:ATP-grasp fold amidoligase family protein [Vibrio parahaemolyticus]
MFNVNKNITNFIRDSLRALLGIKIYNKLRFILTHKYYPNFSNPKTFSEKIQYRKFYEDPNKYSKFADKLQVRDYIQDVVGGEFLVPLILSTEKLTLSQLTALPSKFVVKSSNGGGGVNVKVVQDKSKEDLHSLCEQFNRYLTLMPGKGIDELFYDIETPTVLVEELLENKDNSILLDYKFHVFNNGELILLQINSEYNTPNCTKTLYDLDGNKYHIQFSKYKHGPSKINLPQKFSDMVDIVTLLSKPFNYVRVDLFNVDGKIYFGEMTFCPASGWDKFGTYKDDLYLGNFWK